MNRYARQQQVSVMGPASAQLLAEAKVLIVGAGGLGSPVSLWLAGAGVGEITLVDDDVVSLSNLHRQILYQESDLHKPKVDRAQSRLKALNSDIKINAVHTKLTPDNIDGLISKATVVVDAADNFLVSYLLSDVCLQQQKPLVSASVISTHGYLGVFCGTEQQTAPSLRALFAMPSGPNQNCSTAGVTGPSVGIIGSYQAQEVLKVILNDPQQLLGKLMYVDAWSYEHNIIDFNDAPEPESFAAIVSSATVTQQDMLIDVRSHEEFTSSNLHERAINKPIEQIKAGQFDIAELNQEQRVVCICASGQRALSAAHILLNQGVKHCAVTSI